MEGETTSDLSLTTTYPYYLTIIATLGV